MRRRTKSVAVLAWAALLLAGWYGSTKPATHLGFDHATLNGKGTTNNGPANVYFEYWPTRALAPGRRRSHKTLPAA